MEGTSSPRWQRAAAEAARLRRIREAQDAAAAAAIKAEYEEGLLEYNTFHVATQGDLKQFLVENPDIGRPNMWDSAHLKNQRESKWQRFIQLAYSTMDWDRLEESSFHVRKYSGRLQNKTEWANINQLIKPRFGFYLSAWDPVGYYILPPGEYAQGDLRDIPAPPSAGAWKNLVMNGNNISSFAVDSEEEEEEEEEETHAVSGHTITALKGAAGAAAAYVAYELYNCSPTVVGMVGTTMASYAGCRSGWW
jgi:hypothetical protein